MEAEATKQPTKKQQQLLDFIGEFQATHRVSPSYREIMAGLGYSSVATVAEHVKNLIAKGLLEKTDLQARSVAVVKPTVYTVDFEQEILVSPPDEAVILQKAWDIMYNRTK
ncbi:hypothetical protein FWH13_02955 [Candidatus Saccharibacteria bacterium]|nr:hypothetical protein [Candidatus Saccharibacteria bacterium]